MKEHYYLDNASTTWPKPEPVYRFMDAFFRSHGVNPGRAGHTLAIEAEQMIFETRRLPRAVLRFPRRSESGGIHPERHRLAEHRAVRPRRRGGPRRHHAGRAQLRAAPLYHLERDHGVRVTRVGADAEGYVDPDAVRDALRPRTRVVVVNHGSNVLGSVQDLAAIGAVAREAPGAVFVVDTAQSAGVLPIDMDALGIDVLCFTGHKGLFGPMGIGGMIVAEGVEIRHGRGGWHRRRFDLDVPARRLPTSPRSGHRLDPGHRGPERRAEMVRGSRPHPARRRIRRRPRHRMRTRARHIESVEVSHIRHIRRALDAMDGVAVYGPHGNRPRVATLSFNVEGLPATQVSEMLDADHHVCVRAGLHCAPLVHEDQGTAGDPGRGADRPRLLHRR